MAIHGAGGVIKMLKVVYLQIYVRNVSHNQMTLSLFNASTTCFLEQKVIFFHKNMEVLIILYENSFNQE